MRLENQTREETSEILYLENLGIENNSQTIYSFIACLVTYYNIY